MALFMLVPTILLILIVVYCKRIHRKQQSPLKLNVYSATEELYGAVCIEMCLEYNHLF